MRMEGMMALQDGVEMVRMNVEVPEDLLAELRQRANGVGRSVSDVVRGLMVEWVRAERVAEAEMLTLRERRERGN
jgi:hypothetical protein